MTFLESAKAWVEGDVDPKDIAELSALIAARDEAKLADLFGRTAEFGTAGLRELVGPGPARMNSAVVRRTTHAVGKHLLAEARGEVPLVVVGWDGRVESEQFARDTVGVLVEMGIRVRHFQKPVPTPLVAFALRHYQASAAVVITASHNGRHYNGYKLYAANGAQIVSPVDTTVARLIAEGPRANAIAVASDALDGGHSLALPVEASAIDAYFEAILALRPDNAPCRELGIVYTPVHGVGGEAVQRVLGRAGFSKVSYVKEQLEPDGTFPTAPEPNPEHVQTLELARRLGDRERATLILANDPDADRLAVSVRSRAGSWEQLSGNQIGILLMDYQLSRYAGDERPLVAYSIVSTPMVAAVADEYGAHAEPTLTGFKWLWTAALGLRREHTFHFVFGFEEALGYCAEDIVRDKDGVSALLLFAEMAAEEASRQRTVLDRLERLYRKYGLWSSEQVSYERKDAEGLAAIRKAMERLSSKPPEQLLGSTVSSVVNYAVGAEARPPWLGLANMIELRIEDGTRLLARPSGTEPKLKLYADVLTKLEPDSSYEDALARGRARAKALGEALLEFMTQ